MDSNRCKILLLDCLSEKLKEVGFKYIKAKSAFVRKVSFGEQWYTLTFLTYSGQDGFEINPGHHVRCEKVEAFFHETSGFSKKDQKGTTTIGCSLENYLANGRDMFRMSVKNENDAFMACDYYSRLFEEKVIPFFESFKTLESLHELINKKPQTELNIINPIFRGIKGIIVANFLGVDEIDRLIDIYSRQYETFYDGFYKPDLDKVIENLK
jgi:hypothetical protein